jgi:hypothetical protein
MIKLNRTSRRAVSTVLQLDGLGANSFIPTIEGSPRDDIDPNTEKVLKILQQTNMINKRGAFVEVHEQIQVAAWARLSPGDRAEHRDPARPTLPRDAQNLRAPLAQFIQGQHVVAHGSKYVGGIKRMLTGETWCISFVTLGELTKWTVLRSWGPHKLAELAEVPAGTLGRGSARH